MEEFTEPKTVESAMKESASIFEGHPADESGDENLGETDEAKKESEEAKKQKPVFKYASQEAAETAYKEAEKLIGKKADEAKRERERVEELQKQLNEMLAEPKKLEPEKITSATKMKDLLEKVNNLDPEDEDYHLKVAEIWGQREDDIQTNFDAKLNKALEDYDKKAKENQAKVNNESSMQKKIVADAEVAGTKIGLDMKDKSVDSELFWAFADKAPEGTIEEQVEWSVNKVKEMKTAIADSYLKSGNKAKTVQEQNTVLERGGNKPVEKAVPETPLSLSTAFGQLQRKI